MPSLIDLRRRVRAVKNTQQITKAMKMVAASKLRRAQERIMSARPYSVQIQRVEHESRVHIDIETDDIPAEVMRLVKLCAKVVNRLERWVVMQAPTGQRFCVVRVQRPGFPKNANRWD